MLQGNLDVSFFDFIMVFFLKRLPCEVLGKHFIVSKILFTYLQENTFTMQGETRYIQVPHIIFN